MATAVITGVRPAPKKDETPPASQTKRKEIPSYNTGPFQPIQVFRFRCVSAAIFDESWRYPGEKEPTLFISVRKSQWDARGWHNTHTFCPEDLPLAILALQKCYEWLYAEKKTSPHIPPSFYPPLP